MTDPRPDPQPETQMDRRRFLGGTALLGVAAALGPAGLAALRRVTQPGGPDVTHAGQLPHVHPAHPVLPMPVYVTEVVRRRTPQGVVYLEAVARPADPSR